MFDLNVPYREKDEAKRFGARWDSARRIWYYPLDTLPEGLRRWYEGDLDNTEEIDYDLNLTPEAHEATEAIMIAPGVDLNSFKTVEEVANMIADKFNRTPEFATVMVKGEVVNYRPSAHYFFSVKDANATISCKMWASEAASALDFTLESGQQVAIIGRFEFDSKYGTALHVRKIYNAGEGAAYLELQRLRSQLQAEGLFDLDHKKAIPEHPDRIGVVTSKDGQAIQDIVKTATRRNPYAQLILYHVKVQGEGADLTIVEGIKALDKAHVDVIIVGRGGGSDEDLKAFNSEAIARTVYAANTPIVSAVGHAGNTTLIDEVADKFAVTPTAAAELVCPDILSEIKRINDIALSMRRNAETNLENRLLRLERIKATLEKNSPTVKVKEQEARLENATKFLKQNIKIIFDSKELRYENAFANLSANMKQLFDYKLHRYELLVTKLNGLSPSAKLVNGFGYISKDGKAVNSVTEIQTDDNILVTVSDGEIGATVTFANAKKIGGE
ncbi:MAG: exodeoxyribonuclease VII large subunit [Lachnospiraceae bacterium]|nr:exodeoxyribonuclease VII large subunit [Lachnospiraceae bacterium]